MMPLVHLDNALRQLFQLDQRHCNLAMMEELGWRDLRIRDSLEEIRERVICAAFMSLSSGPAASVGSKNV